MTSLVENLMSKRVFPILSGKNILEAAEAMAENQIGSLPAIGEGNYAGIITECDIVRKEVAKGIDPSPPQWERS